MYTKDPSRRIRSTTPLTMWRSVEGVYLRRLLGWTGIAIIAVIGVELILTGRLPIGVVVTTIAVAGAAGLRSRTEPVRPLPIREKTPHDDEEASHEAGSWGLGRDAAPTLANKRIKQNS